MFRQDVSLQMQFTPLRVCNRLPSPTSYTFNGAGRVRRLQHFSRARADAWRRQEIIMLLRKHLVLHKRSAKSDMPMFEYWRLFNINLFGYCSTYRAYKKSLISNFMGFNAWVLINEKKFKGIPQFQMFRDGSSQVMNAVVRHMANCFMHFTQRTR